MSTLRLVAVARWFEALAHRDFERVVGCYAPDAVLVTPVYSLRGTDALRDYFRFRCLSSRLYGPRGWHVSYEVDEKRSTNAIILVHWCVRWSLAGLGHEVRQTVVSGFNVDESGYIIAQRDNFSTIALGRQILPRAKLMRAIISGSLARIVAQTEYASRNQLARDLLAARSKNAMFAANGRRTETQSPSAL